MISQFNIIMFVPPFTEGHNFNIPTIMYRINVKLYIIVIITSYESVSLRWQQSHYLIKVLY